MASTRQTGSQSGSQRSAARTAVVWDALRDVLGQAPDDDRALSVLDIGGGTGGFAVRVAELGHRVTVVDPSPDALAILARRAEESGVAERVHARQGDLAGLAGLVAGADGADGIDLVLCHGLLEIVESPRAALATILDVLRPGGTLSLLVNQRHAAVLSRAMAGHFVSARQLLDDTGGPDGAAGPGGARRFTAEEVRKLLDDAGFEIRALHAVRAFTDLVPSALVDLEPGAAAALVELERAVSDRPEYLALATQLHVLAVRR
ncbi:MAG: methyltransferase domain-containing protein [Nocardioidaceae bacterium]